MNRDMKSNLGMAGAAAAAAVFAAATIAAGDARADDITIDNTPPISAATTAQMQSPFKRSDLPKHSPDEFTLQYNQVPQVNSSYTPAQVRAEYATNRDAVRALTAEDSGSTYFWKRPGSATNVMGGAAR